MGYMANPRMGLEHIAQVELQNRRIFDRDGYLHTYIRGAMDKEGFLQVHGRIKNQHSATNIILSPHRQYSIHATEKFLSLDDLNLGQGKLDALAEHEPGNILLERMQDSNPKLNKNVVYQVKNASPQGLDAIEYERDLYKA